MRIARTNFDRQEARRDRRYALPPLTVVIGGREFATGPMRNPSLKRERKCEYRSENDPTDASFARQKRAPPKYH